MFDNVLKAWIVGTAIGDHVLGRLTSLPGMVIDAVINVGFVEESDRYNYTSLSYTAIDYPSFSRIFAFPGKVVGNTLVPLACALIALGVLLPNLIIRTLNRAYDLMKKQLDKGLSFLARLSFSVDGSEDIDEAIQSLGYLQKSFYAGFAVLGNIVGAAFATVGLVFDFLLSLVGFNTEYTVSKSLFSGGVYLGGMIGGLLGGVSAGVVHPAKASLDTTFYLYRALRDKIDSFSAIIFAKYYLLGPRNFQRKTFTPEFNRKLEASNNFSLKDKLSKLFSLSFFHSSPWVARSQNISACPVTFEPFSSNVNDDSAPMVVCGEGHTISRAGFTQLQAHGTTNCPCCRGNMLNAPIPNRVMMEAIPQLEQLRSREASSSTTDTASNNNALNSWFSRNCPALSRSLTSFSY